MRELTSDEIENVSGGIVPLLGFGLSLIAKGMGSAGVTGWAVGSLSLVLSSWSLADYYIGAG